MYEQVFNFNSRPFTSTPYVKHFFPASAMNQAFGQASICIERGSGPVVAIGDIGTGKSLLLAKLEDEYQTQLQVVTLVCASVNNRREFLQNVLFQIGKPFNMDSETELRFAVMEAAQPTEASPNGMLLLIDDAEMLTADVFDELRVLSNVVVDGTPQVRLVLAGRKSLEERLADPAHASFSQRIASRVFLTNLNRQETADYVVAHINRVGGDGQLMFPAETTAKLHELTDGCPRLINQVCDFVLILAGTRGMMTVSTGLIEEAWNDVQSLPMGSGSVVTDTVSQQAATTEDSDWTLIEFGQLDDDAPKPAGATVYDFANSDGTEDSIAGYSQAEEQAFEQGAPTQSIDQPELEASVRTEVDSDLGIDLGSLQAMQDAAAAKHSAVSPADTDAPAAESVDEISTDNPDTGLETTSLHDAARIAREQQLAAVFGSLSSSPPVETEASESKPVRAEPEVGELQPPMQTNFGAAEPLESDEPDESEEPGETDEPDAADEPSESNEPTASSIVGAVAGATVAGGALAAALNSFAPTTSANEETPSVEESFTPATSALDEKNLDADSLVTNEHDVASETPSADSFTPAFLVDGTDGFVPATQPIQTHEPSIEITPESSTEADGGSSEALVAQDPFAESFASEASVPTHPTSEIIEQNQNALKISSSDLEHVQPLHAPTPDEIIHPDEPAAASVPNESVPVGVSWMEDATSESDDAPVDDQPTPVDEVTEAPNVEAKPSRGFSIMPLGQTAGSKAPADEIIEQASDSVESVTTIPVEATSEAKATAETASSNETHDHKDDIISEDISRQADAILARLNNAKKPPVVEQEEQILADIQAQQREVADSHLIDDSEPQASLPLPIPALHQDDSAMLVVNQAADSQETPDEPETFPMTDSPVSSGRASRMDYEKLFDRLRNLPEDEQE